jgi:hypothetical protein
LGLEARDLAGSGTRRSVSVAGRVIEQVHL